MFKPLWGVLAGALALSSLLVRPAQARDLELLEVYEVAASMISRQNPLFLFPGLQADRMTVNGNGGEYHVTINGLGLPGSTATVPEPVVVRLPRSTNDGDLIEVIVEGLPTSTIMPGGQSLKLIEPRFTGYWSVSRRGFERFELSVDSVRFQGAGIAYSARGIEASLGQERGRHVMRFIAKEFNANYGDSFTGSERAKGLEIELSAPVETFSADVLVAIGYRISGLAFNETEVQEVLAPNPPQADSLNGLEIKLEFEGESWEQIVPPSKGALKKVAATIQVDESAGNGLSKVLIDASIGSITQTLEQMDFRVQRPSTFTMVLDGVESRSLADLLLDRSEGFDEPEIGESLSFQASVDVGKVAVIVPDVDLDFGAKSLAGSLSSEADGDGNQTLVMQGTAEQIEVVNWLNRDQLEPFASKIIAPGMPAKTQIELALEGLSSADVQKMVTAALALDLGGVAGALPSDLSGLTVVLQNSFYKSKLVEAEWSGRLKPRRGRIPVQGDFKLVTGQLAPMQIGMQQSIGTPVPAVSQAMSAGILGLTLLQTFAVREDGGKLLFDIEFPEEGGLPLVNGRPLPFQQFLR